MSLPNELHLALQGDGVTTFGVASFHTRMLVVPDGHVLFSIDNNNRVWDYAPDVTTIPSAWQPTP